MVVSAAFGTFPSLPDIVYASGGGCVYVLQMFFFVFLLFPVFFRPPQNTRQPFLGTAERIFMTLLPNDTGENGV